jgi:hypothetical protein
MVCVIVSGSCVEVAIGLISACEVHPAAVNIAINIGSKILLEILIIQHPYPVA